MVRSLITLSLLLLGIVARGQFTTIEPVVSTVERLGRAERLMIRTAHQIATADGRTLVYRTFPLVDEVFWGTLSLLDNAGRVTIKKELKGSGLYGFINNSRGTFAILADGAGKVFAQQVNLETLDLSGDKIELAQLFTNKVGATKLKQYGAPVVSIAEDGQSFSVMNVSSATKGEDVGIEVKAFHADFSPIYTQAYAKPPLLGQFKFYPIENGGLFVLAGTREGYGSDATVRYEIRKITEEGMQVYREEGARTVSEVVATSGLPLSGGGFALVQSIADGKKYAEAFQVTRLDEELQAISEHTTPFNPEQTFELKRNQRYSLQLRELRELPDGDILVATEYGDFPLTKTSEIPLSNLYTYKDIVLARLSDDGSLKWSAVVERKQDTPRGPEVGFFLEAGDERVTLLYNEAFGLNRGTFRQYELDLLTGDLAGGTSTPFAPLGGIPQMIGPVERNGEVWFFTDKPERLIRMSKPGSEANQ